MTMIWMIFKKYQPLYGYPEKRLKIGFLRLSRDRCNLRYPNNPEFNTSRDGTIDGMANKVLKRLVRRAEPANQNRLREVAISCVTGER